MVCAVTLLTLNLQHLYTTLGVTFLRAIHRRNAGDSLFANDGQWYNYSIKNFRLFVYSAFYDDRPSLLSDPIIRIIGFSDPIDDLRAKNVTLLYCILRHDAKDIVVIMKDSPKAIGFGWPINKKNAYEYMYICPTLTGMIPESVSIVASLEEDYPLGVPVTVQNKPAAPQNFCVCVHAVYGALDPYRIIEWMELQKILGINFVGVSVFSSTNLTVKVFKHYIDEGFLDIRKTNPIYPNDVPARHYKIQLSPTINDCIYRHMFEFRRIIVMDFDEFIIPRLHRSIWELLADLEERNAKNKTIKLHFAFRNNYFFMNLPPDDKMSPYLKVLQFRKKGQVYPAGYSVKSIINPQACSHAHNHYCWGVTANYTKHSKYNYDFTQTVDPTYAVNQHYKMCHFTDEHCDSLFQNVTQDDIMLKFKDILSEKVREKVKIIMDHDI